MENNQMGRFVRMKMEDVAVHGFDAVRGDFYEIIGPDDEERLVFECVTTGNVSFKYFRQKNRNIWLLGGPGKLLFCVAREING